MGHMPVLPDCGDVQGNRKQFQIKEPGGSRLIPSAEVGASGQHSGAPRGSWWGVVEFGRVESGSLSADRGFKMLV